MSASDLEAQIIELEIRLALQDDTIDVLSQQVSDLFRQLDLQQQQLQLLYRKMSEASENDGTSSSAHEPPPHY